MGGLIDTIQHIPNTVIHDWLAYVDGYVSYPFNTYFVLMVL